MSAYCPPRSQVVTLKADAVVSARLAMQRAIAQYGAKSYPAECARLHYYAAVRANVGGTQ